MIQKFTQRAQAYAASPLIIQDLIVSEFAARAAYQNHFEQLRDTFLACTSHTKPIAKRRRR